MRRGFLRLAILLLGFGALLAVSAPFAAKPTSEARQSAKPSLLADKRQITGAQPGPVETGERGTPQAEQTAQQQWALLDFHAIRNLDLWVSEDATRLRLGFTIDGNAPREQVIDWQLRLWGARGDANLTSPLHASDTTSLPIRGWYQSHHPTLALHRLRIASGDRVRALAIAPQGDRFALGTDRGLYYFAANRGPILPKPARLWQRFDTAAVQAVNFAQAGKILIAVYQDGRIRWHRAEDGRVLLTLRLLLDRNQARPHWILMTPEGYFAASSGARRLIHWHLQQHVKKASDFVASERLRKLYHRPDIVAATLRWHSSEMAIARLEFGQARLAARYHEPFGGMPTLVSVSAP